METNKTKTVYFLIGPKGSGKTYIGKVLEKSLSKTYLNVETLLIAHCTANSLDPYKLEKHGFPIEESAIDLALVENNSVIVEGTGSSIYFEEHLNNLKFKYEVKLIRVRCPLDVCQNRAMKRDNSEQILVPEKLLKEINEKASRANFDWDLEIDNSAPAPQNTIVSLFSKII